MTQDLQLALGLARYALAAFALVAAAIFAAEHAHVVADAVEAVRGFELNIIPDADERLARLRDRD